MLKSRITALIVCISMSTCLSACASRSKLRGYALNIQSGTLTPQELKEYLELGGSKDTFKSYDFVRDLLVGSTKIPIINLILKEQESALNPAKLEMIEALLNAGANPNMMGGQDIYPNWVIEDFAPIQYAAKINHLAAVRLLVKYNADVNFSVLGQTDFEETVSHPPLELTKDPLIAQFLIDAGANQNFINEQGRSLLHMAAKNAQTEMLKFWLQVGLSTALQDGDKRTPTDLAEMEIEWREDRENYQEGMLKQLKEIVQILDSH